MTAVPRAVATSINSWSAPYLEAQYNAYKANPDAVSPDLRAFFQGFDLALAQGGPAAPAHPAARVTGQDLVETLRFQHAVGNLIDSYRRRGHMCAQLDPFGRPRPRPAALTLEYYGLSDADLDRPVDTGIAALPPTATLRQVIEFLERTYCGTIGAEFMHVSDDEERAWLVHRFEADGGRVPLTRGQRAHVLEQLTRSEQFEKFLGKRYPGDKRFSLEGGESLIPLMDRILEAWGELGVEEVVIGMPHRGRLNVLNNIMGKTYEQIFTEFEDNWDDDFADRGGDVKYHRGYSGERHLRSGRILHLAMASNPSHLESVNGVVQGRCRAKQWLKGDTERTRVVPMLIHGDAAVIGQGVVAEVLNYSQLEGYTTGGTVHIVVNNLIGFTTGPEDARSSRYATDIGMVIEAPVFHVNAEDPDAVVAVGQFAAEYRQRFRKDVFIDLWCFRRYGHNEQDEPSFTQPILAELIRKKPSVLQVYAQRLRDDNVITDKDIEAIRTRLDAALEAAQAAAKAKPHDPVIEAGSKRWAGITGKFSFTPVDTGVPMSLLQEVCAALGRVPEGFNLNPKLRRLLEDRANLCTTGELTYADAESLAFGTLLLEGHHVRLSGQDSRRGTFSHRHAVLRDVKTAECYIPLNNMRPIAQRPDDAGKPGPDGRLTQARFDVFDSPLSEMSVMAFDYGYSLADPNALVCWEAQFGDFVNGAQVIIDQFLCSAELKWERWSGLVLLLPHGYEGAGPEHSSARIERFLDLCADENMQVVYPSTAAQCFHMFRRQLKVPFRKPLIVATPKSLLRYPTSHIEELTRGHFQDVLDDPVYTGVRGSRGADRKSVKRIILCTGKFYHDMDIRRKDVPRPDTALVRIEQLYPFNVELMREVLSRYPKNAKLVWAQEEPRNKGAYHFIADIFRTTFGVELEYIGRPASATPAVGSKHRHKEQQEELLTLAIGPLPVPADHASGNGRAAEPGKASTKKVSARV